MESDLTQGHLIVGGGSTLRLMSPSQKMFGCSGIPQ